MAGLQILTAILLVFLITDVRTQFYDFFQGFQPILYQQPNRPTTKHHAEEVTTKRPKSSSRRNEQTTKRTPISYGFEDADTNIRQVSREKQHKRKPTTIFPIFNLNIFTTTVKPVRKTKITSSHRNSASNFNSEETPRVSKPDSRFTSTNNAKITESETPSRWYEKPIISNIADDYYTTKPYYEVTSKPSNYNNYDSSNSYDSRPNINRVTTKNPFYNRPGVKPAVVENRPPITNRPVTKRPFVVNSRPTDAGSIAFPEDDVGPEMISGPDEDYMSEVDKRRYVDLAERMCDKYKSLNMKQLQAIPLVPSPEPVQVNVSSCTPTNVPLVVGGKVVSIREFPHMALLGWVKIDGGGYSWKCGGSLVSEQYVLTAAHCAYQERDNTVISGAPRVVQLGSSYLDDPGALVVRVAAVIRHSKYRAARSYYDIALLKLATPVSFSEVIKPACLGVPPPPGKPIIATGWGLTQAGGEQSQELRSVSLPIWDIGTCSRTLGTSRKMPSGPSADSQVCAGEPRGGKDTCQGDSGGPAQIQEGCTWRVVAVTSIGRSCAAPNTPGLYSIVHHAFVAAQVFGGHRNKNNNQNVNNNNQNVNNNNQNVYNNNQNIYDNNQNANNNHQNVYNNNQRTETTNRNPQNKNQRTDSNRNHRADVSNSNEYTQTNNQRSDNRNAYDIPQNYGNQQQNDYTNNNQRSDYRTDYNRRNDERYLDPGRVWWT